MAWKPFFEIATGRQPDIVITDWKMPHVDGLALSKMLPHSNPRADLPVILVSGDPPPTDGRATLRNGFSASRFHWRNCRR
ncbi:response regulator [Paraburkholderia madseniana]|uniref:Response regulator n=2 Tax=Paraburkholderia TaxID=1822464 RepID=A0A6N6W020_9BURK|nr:response regulator [Paraburkholderia madseniana]